MGEHALTTTSPAMWKAELADGLGVDDTTACRLCHVGLLRSRHFSTETRGMEERCTEAQVEQYLRGRSSSCGRPSFDSGFTTTAPRRKAGWNCSVPLIYGNCATSELRRSRADYRSRSNWGSLVLSASMTSSSVLNSLTTLLVPELPNSGTSLMIRRLS